MPATPPIPSRSPRRCIVAVWVLISFSAACGTALVDDHATVPKPAASAPETAARSNETPKEVKPPIAVPARGPQDPMDMLRERLARKLGAAKSADSKDSNVLRVVSKASVPTAAMLEPAAPVSTAPARRRPMPPASAHALPIAGADHAAYWDYVGGAGSAGPSAWGRMKPEFAKCASGTRQSPIDIRDGIKVELDAVQFNYQPSAFRVIDNGHTVQVNVAPGNSIEVMGRRYELLQFHFHRPCEERIDGKQFDMVVHLVHKGIDGRLAVVAVLLERGSAQSIMQNVWNNLPLEKGDEIAARAPLNPNDLLPAERRYFTYMGSLTTPPCSEGVLWVAMKQPVQASAEQIDIFARLYPMNARPTQSAAGRLIKESN